MRAQPLANTYLAYLAVQFFFTGGRAGSVAKTIAKGASEGEMSKQTRRRGIVRDSELER